MEVEGALKWHQLNGDSVGGVVSGRGSFMPPALTFRGLQARRFHQHVHIV